MADTLAPGFLVASPALRDPSFLRAVVLLVEHGEGGSMGFIVNQPAPISFWQVSLILGLEAAADHPPPASVFLGGPVAPRAGWILFDPAGVGAELRANAVEVSERLAVSASRRLLEAIASEEGPARCLLALGYAGWEPGQLDGEFARGIWVPVDLDEEIVFEMPASDRWRAALTSAAIDPGRMSTRGGFSA